jgi:hypothetical protein
MDIKISKVHNHNIKTILIQVKHQYKETFQNITVIIIQNNLSRLPHLFIYCPQSTLSII